MVLRIAEVVVNALLPREHWVKIAVGVLVLVVVCAFAQGRTTSRERDLHGRVILVTVSQRCSHNFRSFTDIISFREVSRPLVLL